LGCSVEISENAEQCFFSLELKLISEPIADVSSFSQHCSKPPDGRNKKLFF